MGWLKDLLGTEENKYAKMLKSAQEEETREKEFQSLPYIGRMATAEDKERADINRIEEENAQQLEPKRAEREQKQQANLDQLLVINGAKLECQLCTNPQGILKVNFDTPTTQDKKTATIKEKDASSLIFMGNCKKSHKSSRPCASVMKLGEWKDTGNMKIQDQPPLLLKSTIPCLYGGINIKITDSGQVNEPEILDLFGDAVPLLVSLRWLDKENKEIPQNKRAKVFSADAKNLIDFSFNDIHYGEPLKLVLKINKGREEKEISVSIQSDKGDFSKNFGKLPVNANQEVETPYFSVPISAYDEAAETYHYNRHITTVQESEIQKIHAIIEGVDYTKKEEMLIPFIYRRNYEELIGLFHTNDSGVKDSINNYETYFIKKSAAILEIAKGFSEYINETEALSLELLKQRVEEDAKKLWSAAVQQVQGGDLDDRPLYWARNKMQVRLKQHALFKNDIDFEKSIVKKGTELEKLIQLFEEKSRNYTGIDFSKAPKGSKKVLITGFDPFQLDPKYILYGLGPKTFNPSGLLALNLHNDYRLLKENIFVQTSIFPVRYDDFDNGCVERIIGKYIDQVDIIITLSKNNTNIFDIEKYASKSRGGFHDNIYWGNNKDGYNESYFKKDIGDGKQEYETTLPYIKILKNNKSTVIYNNDVQLDESKTSNKGSGGDYLSNEIFYRVAKLRENIKPTLATGHLHLSYKHNLTNIEEALKIVKEIVKRAVL